MIVYAFPLNVLCICHGPFLMLLILPKAS